MYHQLRVVSERHSGAEPGRSPSGRARPAARWAMVVWLLGSTSVAQAQDDPTYTNLVLTENPVPAAPDSGKALVFLVRELYVRMDALPDEIVMVNGEAAGLLRQRTWFALQLEPGRHVLWGVHQGQDLVLECRSGRSYMVRLRERVDDKDRIVREWLRDDPAGLGVLIKRHGLRHAGLTPRGAAWIASRRKHMSHSELPVAADHVSSGRAPWRFEHMLSERPLDRMNLETDFSMLTGRLTLDSTGLRYRLRARVRSSLTSWVVVSDSLDVEFTQVERIRLGGTRFTGAAPWLDVIYHTPLGLRIASFGDAEEMTAVTTYNRLFAVLEGLLSTRPPEGAGELEASR